MKKYFIYLLLLSFSLTSCQDAIEKALEPKIYSEFTDANFPTKDEHIAAVLATFYANFGSSWGPIDPADTNKKTNKMWAVYCCMNGWSQLSSATTDELTDTWLPVKYKFGWAKNENVFLYPALYQRVALVAKATSFIDIFQKQLDALIAQGKLPTDKSVKLRKVAIAELKGFRAWTMFLLYDWFGAVDVKTSVEDLNFKDYKIRPAANPTSDFTKAYLAQMVKDFKEARVDIYQSRIDSAGTGVGNIDHIHKDVINMLLMKHYMNYAAETGLSTYWDSAKIYCDDIIKSNKYKLDSVYSNVFLERTGEKNSEIIWRTSYGSDPQLVGFHFQSNLPLNCIEICGIPTKGNYWSGFVMPWDFYDTYNKKDTRLAGIADHYYVMKDSSYTDPKTKKKVTVKVKSKESRQDPSGQLTKGAIVLKWLKSDVSDQGQFGVTAFRYADVLLSAAEIELNRVGRDVVKAQQYIRYITDRSHTSSTVDTTIVEKSKTINGKLTVRGAATALAPGCDPDIIKEFLFQERGRELYWEGWRRMDMIRFKRSDGKSKYLEYAAKYNENNLNHKGWEKFPLPLKVLTEAGDKYQDNEGY